MQFNRNSFGFVASSEEVVSIIRSNSLRKIVLQKQAGLQDFAQVRRLIAHPLPPQVEEHLEHGRGAFVEETHSRHLRRPTVFGNKAVVSHKSLGVGVT